MQWILLQETRPEGAVVVRELRPAFLPLEQTGLHQFPVENVALAKGWNWIGHAPLHIYPIAEIVPVNGSPGFSADNQIKTRAGISLGTSTFSGTSWQGDLGQLAPGIGYEVKVSQAMTFNYGDSSDHSD